MSNLGMFFICNDCGSNFHSYRLQPECRNCASIDVYVSREEVRVPDKPTVNGQANFEARNEREKRLLAIMRDAG